ncbi:MAG: S8 family serine peptidase [Acidimicrobiia bacterium]|nr:S8 family serine peptidase [Acidimicrobiia bacterium]
MNRPSLRRTAAAIALLLPGLIAAPAAARMSGGADQAVIVEASDSGAAAAAVAAAGGRVDADLGLVGGVAATVDARALAMLSADPDLRVTPDMVLEATGSDFDPASHDLQLSALDPADGWSADAGAGVGVALIDTGVAEAPDLAGRVIRGPDLSGEGDGVDRYGHGTFMAGLIAGDGSASAGDAVPHTGVAPGASVVSVKVAGADGRTTLSKLIAGIGWAIVNRDAYEIRVMSLSFGVDTNLPYMANPLSGAVEAAWASGIAVVGAAGNEGDGVVTSPGSDPWIVTVGASDTNGTPDVADDAVPEFSGREDFRRYSKPDVVAPGVSVISLRAPGSTIDTEHPEGRIGDAYFRGSGTSMAAALVAGGLATLVQLHPEATPDDLKGALIDGGVSIEDGSALAVSLDGADQAEPRRDWWQRQPIAFGGLGRGLRDRMPWAATRWSATRWNATRWSATRWNATRWNATRWSDQEWAATRWSATRWNATRWSDQEWAATRWNATRWNATRWSATRWSATRWSDEEWAATRWSATRWSATRWNATRWSDEEWAATRWTDEMWEATRWSSASWNAADWG